MNTLRNGLIATAIASSLVIAGCGSSDDAADFPSDDIRMVITYDAGGPTDAAGRALAAELEDSLGVSVVVENISGASGSVGTAEVVNSKPDGYTIGVTTASAASRVPLIQNVGYQLEDIQPLAMAIQGAAMLLVPADSEFESAEDLLKTAKENPDSVTVATGGAQTPQQIELERLRKDYGISMRTVPHEGDAPMLTALVGGNADAAFASNSDLTMEYIANDEIRPLIFTEKERADYLPDVPTFSELGYEELTHGGSDFIVVAPADLPDEVVTKYDEVLETALTDEAVVKTIGDIRVPDEYVGSDQLTEYLEEEQETLRPIIEEMFS